MSFSKMLCPLLCFFDVSCVILLICVAMAFFYEV